MARSLQVILAVALTIGALFERWYQRTLWLDAEAAAKGFSPELVAALTNHPDWFPGDFPGGTEQMVSSLPYTIYPLVDRLGLDVGATWSIMIWIEMAALALAAIYAAGVLFRQSPPLSRALTAILVCWSGLLQPDLGMFAFPFYGWVYGFALAGFFVAISATFAGQYVTAALALVFTFACHPINGLFTAVFMAAVALPRITTLRAKDILLPALIVLVGCAVWTAYVGSRSTLGGGGVDSSLFVALTKGQNQHWYPLNVGAFWESNARNLLPFVAAIILSLVAIARHANDRMLRRGVLLGIGAMMVLSVAGILISILVESPMLIKLALHRAGSIAVAASSLFVVQMLHRDLTEGGRIERALAAILLLAPFQTVVGCAIVPVVLRTVYAWIDDRRSDRRDMVINVALASAVLATALILFYATQGLVDKKTLALYVGIDRWQMAAAVAAAALPAGLASTWAAPVAVSALAVLAAMAGKDALPMSSKKVLETAKSILSAQLWARDNTPAGSLFMIDPSHPYGWRDKSLRPSFGTLREWLMSSILYDSRPALLEDGIARFKALDADPLPIVLDPGATRMRPVVTKLSEVARDRYYSMERELFERLARTYGIRYFVFEKKRVTTQPPFDVVYENTHYVIAKAP
jgi:hypothetical protein